MTENPQYTGLRQQSTNEVKRFPLKLSPAWRLIFGAVGVLCLWFAVAAVQAGQDGFPFFDVAFFGIGGILVLRLVIKNAGYLTIRADGLLLDSHLTTGLVSWSNFREAKKVKICGADYLGINVRDPGDYLQSRKALDGLVNKTDQFYAQGFMRGMIAIVNCLPPAKKMIDAMIKLLGWSPLPTSIREAEMMEWQERNYGSQIVIQRLWLPDFDAVLNTLSAQREATPTVSGQARPLPADKPATEMKQCPMCAEWVKKEAKICRFCRYSFEERRLLPNN
ncbi:MAG: hypothetical protein HY695_20015 [Deltaproteobacteria bacterium]|nr:hypothetical protein [Deltaproteobacteria bacterium]